MAELQVHTAPNILKFEHGASPCGSGDGDQYRAGAEFGMAGQKSFAAAEKHGGVAVVKSLNLEDGGGWKIAEKNSAFNFRLDDCVVDFVS
jgi:hypothetical protein